LGLIELSSRNSSQSRYDADLIVAPANCITLAGYTASTSKYNGSSAIPALQAKKNSARGETSPEQ
jgi:hypothetical protein